MLNTIWLKIVAVAVFIAGLFLVKKKIEADAIGDVTAKITKRTAETIISDHDLKEEIVDNVKKNIADMDDAARVARLRGDL